MTVSHTDITCHVFICYSHDSRDHMGSVLNLSNRLREEGIECNIDQYEESPPEGWPRWMVKQIEKANFVLVVCTEIYERRFTGKEETGKGSGAKWEGAILTQALHDAEANNTKFIPVFFSSIDSAHIPIVLRSATHYDLSTKEGYEALYRRLTYQPSIVKRERGKIRPMPPRERQQDFPVVPDKTKLLMYEPEGACYVVPLCRQLSVQEPPPNLKIPTGYRYFGRLDDLDTHHLYREQDGHVVLWFNGLSNGSRSFLIDKYQITAQQFSTCLNDLFRQGLVHMESHPTTGAKSCVDLMGRPLAFNAIDRWHRGQTANEPWHYAAPLWGMNHQAETWKPVSGNDLLPATHVTWWGARLYSLWAHRQPIDLSDEEQVFLPTVQEWRAAAVWDISAGRQLLYPWGDTWRREFINYAGYWAGCEVGETKWKQSWATQSHVYRRTRPLPVASLEHGRSPIGCVQMFGNVWEWCKDILDRQGVSFRAVKGGACISPQEHCHPDKQVTWRSEQGNEYIGFRCCFPLTFYRRDK